VGFKVVDRYLDPNTKIPLINDEKGNLCETASPQRIVCENLDGVYDFVAGQHDDKEKRHYDNVYADSSRRTCSVEDLRRMWRNEPGFEQLLESLGDIREKRILLLGNGTSLKELYFLSCGAECVYTDLSIEAVKHVKSIFDESELRHRGLDRIEFHAVDACRMPFTDESFDVIYGCAFVHHIGDLDRFFSEVARCLKPGGICRFLDHAYSPLWQCLKNTVLKPVQLYTHRRHGISPVDKVVTERGGYTRKELSDLKQRHGFSEMLYLRVAFFEQLLQRGTLKLGGRWLRRFKPLVGGLDACLDKVAKLVQKHGIVLVWGFTK